MMQGQPDRLGLPFTGLISFLRGPICTEVDRLDADIAIIGVPSDEGSPWLPGARLGPRAIREMSIKYAGYGLHGYGYYDPDEERRYLEREFRLRRIVDCGDVDIIYTNVEKTFANITQAIKDILGTGAMPVVIGGDHAITYPVVRAFSESIDIIHFDAHVDYRPFVHGVKLSNASPIRLAAELPNVDHITQVGVRSIRNSELALRDSRARGNEVVTVNQLRRHGIGSVFEHLRDGGPVYVSIDIDVLDMPLVPGCSSAEIGGFDYCELKDALAYVAAEREVVGFDLVEVNPMLDVPGRATSLVAAQVILEFLARVVENPRWKTRHKVLSQAPVAA